MLQFILTSIIVLLIILAGYIWYSYTGSVDYTPREQISSYTTPSGNTAHYEKTADLTILKLHGSYDEMGQQYGALAYNQLHTIYQDLVPEYFNRLDKFTLLSFFLRSFYDYKLDQRERDILNGMTKTTGLTYKQLLSIEMLPMLITLYSGFNGDKLSDAGGLGHCSFLSVWGKRSATDQVLVARNLDLSTAVTKLDDYYSMVVFNPTNNGHSVATFGFLGFIPGFTWINQYGLFSEYNDGRRSVPGIDFSGYIGLNTAFYGMLSSKTSDEFIKYVDNHPAYISNFTAIADTINAKSIEHAAKSPMAVLDGQLADAIYFTNLYRTEFARARITMSNCIEKTKDTPSYACVRYHHIAKYLDKTSNLGINELKDLFTTDLDNGGVYQTGSSSNYPVAEVTNYTLIGELATGAYIYSNHKNPTKWVKIDVNDYFVK